MWSSEQTPVLSPPTTIGHAWSGEYSVARSPVCMETECPGISLATAVDVDRALEARFAEEEEEQPASHHQRGGRTSAVIGRVRRLLSRSRSRSVGSGPQTGRKRLLSSGVAAAVAVAGGGGGGEGDGGSSGERCGGPASQPLFSRSSSATSTLHSSGGDNGGLEGSAEAAGERGPPQNPDRAGREENFHAAMDNKLILHAFTAFCEKSLAAENIEFVRQVRLLEQLSAAEGTTTTELRERLGKIEAQFVRPGSATEINVAGSTREDALCTVRAAMEAAGTVVGGPWGWRQGAESPWAWVVAAAATEALVGLAREVHTVIFDGLWPRFLTSEEFAVMMTKEEMRTVGFKDLDGRLVVSPLPPQHPGEGAGVKRQFSLKMPSLRHTRLTASGGRSRLSSRRINNSPALSPPGGFGGATCAENSPPGDVLGCVSSGGDRRSISTCSFSCDVITTATAAAATAATTKVFATPTARPQVGGRVGSRRPRYDFPSRPPRPDFGGGGSVSGSGSGGCCTGKGEHRRHHHHNPLGGISNRWRAAGRTRGGGSGGAAGVRSVPVSTPASPLKGRPSFFRSAASSRSFSLR